MSNCDQTSLANWRTYSVPPPTGIGQSDAALTLCQLGQLDQIGMKSAKQMPCI